MDQNEQQTKFKVEEFKWLNCSGSTLKTWQ